MKKEILKIKQEDENNNVRTYKLPVLVTDSSDFNKDIHIHDLTKNPHDLPDKNRKISLVVEKEYEKDEIKNDKNLIHLQLKTDEKCNKRTYMFDNCYYSESDKIFVDVHENKVNGVIKYWMYEAK